MFFKHTVQQPNENIESISKLSAEMALVNEKGTQIIGGTEEFM